MSNKLLLGLLFLLIPNAYACFNDIGCQAGNVCVRTGNLMGTCISQGIVYTTGGPSQAVIMAVPQGYTSVTTPGSTTGPVYVPTPGVGVSNTGTTHVPVIPSYVQPPVTGGACTNTVNCQQGFACSRPNGTFYGVCTQVSP